MYHNVTCHNCIFIRKWTSRVCKVCKLNEIKICHKYDQIDECYDAFQIGTISSQRAGFIVGGWGPLPGGTQIWVGQGCAVQASKPLPIFKGDFGRKGYPSWKIGPFFKNFAMAKTRKFGLSQKRWPMFKDFLIKNGTHV